MTAVKIVFGAIACLAMMNPVFAAEPEFGITAEFLSVCDGFSSAAQAAENFLKAEWSEEGKVFREALSPDDMLKKVKSVRAFKVELDNGGEWLAATAEGRMGKSKVAYCSITAVDNDPDGYRQDFELATGLKSTDSISKKIENRNVYAISDDKIYVMREVRTPENGFFTYVRLAPLSAKGK